MKIIAICSARDERLILPKTTDHLFRHGIDEILVTHPKADDSCADLIDHRVLQSVQEDPFHQQYEMTRLARMAKARLADWIIPFDADEFVCTTNGMTIREALSHVPGHIRTIYCPMALHLTMERRVTHAKPLPKVVFRAHEDIHVDWGQHNIKDPEPAIVGPLVIRELQYRDWEHFLAKIERSRKLHAEPHMKQLEEELGYGMHMVNLQRMDEEQLRKWWAEYQNQPTVVDPIT